MAERKETKLRCPTIKFKDFKEWFTLCQAEEKNEKQMQKLLSSVTLTCTRIKAEGIELLI